MNSTSIERFVEIVDHSVAKMDLNTIEECFWDTGDPMIVSARLGFQEVRETTLLSFEPGLRCFY